LPGVRGACVVGLEDPQRGQIVAAVVERRPGAESDADTLREVVRSRLAPYMVPRVWMLVDELPRTSLGKKDREAACVLLRRDHSTMPT
jgi:acyl-coenzyme A synthetase/AMP-(fatty) acid ligase